MRSGLPRFLRQLHDVTFGEGPSDGDALVYDAATRKWKPGAGGGGSSSPVTTHTTELTAAQIRGSFADGGIELAPAPGEGKAIIDASCLLVFSSDFEAFTGSFHVVVEITTDATLASGAFSVTDNQILEALKGAGGGGDIVGVWFGGSLGDSWSGPLSQLDNAPLYFGIKVAAAMGGAGSIAVVSAITTIDLPT